MKIYERWLQALPPLAPRSRVLARLASLAQIGELARRLEQILLSHSKFPGSDTKKAASKTIAVAKLSWPASSCYSNHVPYAYRETYGRDEWGMGETKTKFFFYSNFLFYWLLSRMGFKHTKIRQCCHYPEQAELPMQLKLIPFNLIDWFVASDMLLF